MPESPFYNFKRIAEKGTMAIKRNPDAKAHYYGYLLDQRYKELDWVASDKRRYSYVLSSSLRYSTTAGQAVQLIKANHMTSQVKPLQNKFSTHKKRFQYDVQHVGIVGGQKGFLQDAINYIDFYSVDLKTVK